MTNIINTCSTRATNSAFYELSLTVSVQVTSVKAWSRGSLSLACDCPPTTNWGVISAVTKIPLDGCLETLWRGGADCDLHMPSTPLGHDAAWNTRHSISILVSFNKRSTNSSLTYNKYNHIIYCHLKIGLFDHLYTCCYECLIHTQLNICIHSHFSSASLRSLRISDASPLRHGICFSIPRTRVAQVASPFKIQSSRIRSILVGRSSCPNLSQRTVVSAPTMNPTCS